MVVCGGFISVTLKGHVRKDCPSQGQPRFKYSEEDFDYKVNPLGHCWKCNQPGHVRIKCPKLGKSTDCLLPKRMRKEQGSQGVEDKFKSIFWKVMQKNKWKPADFAAKETEEKQSSSSSIDGIHSENVKTGEKHLLSNVYSLQHRVNNLSIEKRKTSFAQFKV